MGAASCRYAALVPFTAYAKEVRRAKVAAKF
jgi:hypothetical protein